VFVLICYMLINFTWMSWNRLTEWNIRRTGTKKQHIESDGMGDIFLDYPNEEKQSSLYSYWSSKQRNIDQIEEKLSHLEEKDKNEILEAVKELRKTLNDDRIIASLAKFDEIFWHKIKSENWRWIIFDFGLPVVIALLSIVALAYKLWF